MAYEITLTRADGGRFRVSPAEILVIMPALPGHWDKTRLRLDDREVEVTEDAAAILSQLPESRFVALTRKAGGQWAPAFFNVARLDQVKSGWGGTSLGFAGSSGGETVSEPASQVIDQIADVGPVPGTTIKPDARRRRIPVLRR